MTVILRYRDTATYSLKQLERLAAHMGVTGSDRLSLRLAIVNSSANTCAHEVERVDLAPALDKVARAR